MACICCPYGPIVIFPIFLALLASIATYGYTFSCHFFDSTGPASLNFDRGYGLWTIEGTSPVVTKNVTFDSGLIPVLKNITSSHPQDLSLSYLENQACMPWGQFDYSFGELFDDQFTSARALSMTSVVLGSILFLIILFMGCVSFRRSRGVKATGFFCFVEAILTAASFIALESKFCADADSCKLGYSAWVCVAAAALWFITSVFLCCMPSTAADERKSVLPTHQSQSSQEQDKVAATNAGRTNAQVY